jgi:hypothetical protein
MQRVVRWFWITVALIFLFEAWLWDRLQPIAAAIVAWLPKEWVRRRIAYRLDQLPPVLGPVVFVVPLALVLPFKIAGVWLLERHHWIIAIAAFICAKLVGLGATAFVFDASRDRLLRLGWFHALYQRVMAWRAWSHALVEPLRLEVEVMLAETTAKLAAIAAKLATSAPAGTGKSLRLMLRFGRRVRSPLHGGKTEPSDAAPA